MDALGRLIKGTDRKTYLVIGLGRFGSALALRLSEVGAHVVAVDKQRSRVEEFSDRLEYVVQLDATDESALTQVGVGKIDVAVVCIGEKTEGAILVTAILKDMRIPRIVARANNSLQATILAKLGAHQVISPESEMGHRTADLLEHPWLDNFAEVEGDSLIAGRMHAPENMVGKSLQELSLPSVNGMTVTMVEREDAKIMPTAGLVIQKGDTLWLFGEREHIEPLLDAVSQNESQKKAANMEESK